MKSCFMDKNQIPSNVELEHALGSQFEIWNEITNFALEQVPNSISEWKFSGEKYGWSFRISDKKRVIIYLLPREKFFKVAFVFGAKAFQNIQESEISEFIKKELEAAPVYAEGRGIRLEIKDNQFLEDIKKMILFKLEK